MTVSMILGAIYYVVTAVLLFLLLQFYIKPIIKRSLDIKEMKLKNDKYELFNTINTDTVNEILDNYVDKYIHRYVLYKFIANKIEYINKEDMEAMIKNVTKNILLDISELYVYYIGLITAIDSQVDLTSWVKNKVTNKCIEFVASYNSPVQ